MRTIKNKINLIFILSIFIFCPDQSICGYSKSKKGMFKFKRSKKKKHGRKLTNEVEAIDEGLKNIASKKDKKNLKKYLMKRKEALRNIPKFKQFLNEGVPVEILRKNHIDIIAQIASLKKKDELSKEEQEDLKKLSSLEKEYSTYIENVELKEKERSDKYKPSFIRKFENKFFDIPSSLGAGFKRRIGKWKDSFRKEPSVQDILHKDYDIIEDVVNNKMEEIHNLKNKREEYEKDLSESKQALNKALDKIEEINNKINDLGLEIESFKNSTSFDDPLFDKKEFEKLKENKEKALDELHKYEWAKLENEQKIKSYMTDLERTDKEISEKNYELDDIKKRAGRDAEWFAKKFNIKKELRNYKEKLDSIKKSKASLKKAKKDYISEEKNIIKAIKSQKDLEKLKKSKKRADHAERYLKRIRDSGQTIGIKETDTTLKKRKRLKEKAENDIAKNRNLLFSLARKYKVGTDKLMLSYEKKNRAMISLKHDNEDLRKVEAAIKRRLLEDEVSEQTINDVLFASKYLRG